MRKKREKKEKTDKRSQYSVIKNRKHAFYSRPKVIDISNEAAKGNGMEYVTNVQRPQLEREREREGCGCGEGQTDKYRQGDRQANRQTNGDSEIDRG